jgi:hypothetical protein
MNNYPKIDRSEAQARGRDMFGSRLNSKNIDYHGIDIVVEDNGKASIRIGNGTQRKEFPNLQSAKDAIDRWMKTGNLNERA